MASTSFALAVDSYGQSDPLMSAIRKRDWPGGIRPLRRLADRSVKCVQPPRDLGSAMKAAFGGGRSQSLRSATSFWVVAHIDDRKPPKRKDPGHRTGALTTPTSQDQCAPTILTAPLPRRSNCRPREDGFTAICHYRNNVIPSVCYRLPDSQPLARRRGFPHQLEFKDTVLICGVARRLVQLSW